MTQGLTRALARMVNTLGEGNKTAIFVEDDPSLYTTYLTVDISDSFDMLCPLFCIKHVFQVVSTDIERGGDTDNIAVHLQLHRNDRDFKTIDSALKYIFESNLPLSLEKISCKNEVFYGNRNLILTEDLQPIFMVCARCNAITRKINEIIVAVDTELLTNADSAIKKAIMKKLIPYYVGYILHYDHNSVIDSDFEGTPSILFTHINNIRTTKELSASPYNILENNLQTLIDSIDYVA